MKKSQQESSGITLSPRGPPSMGSASTLSCLLLCILHFTGGASAKPHYIVLFPSSFNCPYTGQVHIHLMDLDAPVRVTLHLASSHRVPDVVLEEQGNGVLQLDWPRFSNVSSLCPEFLEIAHLHVSIQGGSLQVFKKKLTVVKPINLGTLVQTDKDFYKPGQTVQFRVVRLDHNLIPSNKKLPLVVMKDPSGKYIGQWREVSPQQGIVDLSFQLAAEAALGKYTIQVEDKTHSFSVVGHGPPHFAALIRLPHFVLVKNEKILLEVCGRYPSGKTFRGRAEARLCLYLYFPYQHIRTCVESRGQTGSNGCFSTEVPAASFNLTNLNPRSRFFANATLMEDGTGLSRTATKSCKIVYETVSITFLQSDKYYKPGIPYTGTVLLKGTNGSALREKEFLLVVGYVTGQRQRKTLLTDRSGRASFKLDTSGWSDKISVYGELKDDPPALEHNGEKHLSYQSVVRFVYPSSSGSKSFLKIHRAEKKLPCDQPHQVKVDYLFEEKAMGKKLQSLDVVFLLVAKATIVTVLKKELPAEAGLRGFFSLELPISLQLAPKAKLLGYVVLPHGEMVSDSIELSVAKCFPNKVNISFSEQRAPVGSQLHLKLQAAPGSLCALYTMDQRTQPSNYKAKLNTNMIYDLLPWFYDEGYPFDSEEFDIPACLLKGNEDRGAAAPAINCFDTPGTESWKICTHIVRTREAQDPDKEPGFSSLLKDATLKVVSNTQMGCVSKEMLQKYQTLLDTRGAGPREVERAGVMQDSGMKMDFLRTWLWKLVPVREGGSAEMTVTVPDAITEWQAGMFCTSPLGFGLAPTTTLTAFKPFFVELALPYAVVQQEAFTLVATVFNYLQQCLRVSVTLVESAELEVLAGRKRMHRDCVCTDEAKSFQWSVRATSLGEVMVTVIAKTLSSSKNLCGTRMSILTAQGQADSETKLLKVQPPRPK